MAGSRPRNAVNCLDLNRLIKLPPCVTSREISSGLVISRSHHRPRKFAWCFPDVAPIEGAARVAHPCLKGLKGLKEHSMKRAHRDFGQYEAAGGEVYEAAVESAIWGTPIVSMDAMRQAFF